VWGSITTRPSCHGQRATVVAGDGAGRFPQASQLMITRRWRRQQRQPQPTMEGRPANLGRRPGAAFRDLPFSPGTSKWNKIEHRLFSFITMNWRGRPLTSYQVIVNLIAHTTTKAGLVVRAAIDTNHYETGIVVSDEEMGRINITPAKFHGE